MGPALSARYPVSATQFCVWDLKKANYDLIKMNFFGIGGLSVDIFFFFFFFFFKYSCQPKGYISEVKIQ